jgi:hypothetical protein
MKKVEIKPGEKIYKIHETLLCKSRLLQVKLEYSVPPADAIPAKISLRLVDAPNAEKVVKDGEPIQPGAYLFRIVKEGYEPIEKKVMVWPHHKPYSVAELLRARKGTPGSDGEMDLQNFIEMVSQTTGYSILYDSAVSGRKFFLTQRKWDSKESLFKVFLSVVEYNGFVLEQVGDKDKGLFKLKRNIMGPWTQTPILTSANDLAAVQNEDAFVSMVIPLKHISAREVQVVLRALRLVNPQAGNLGGIEESNMILITDYAPNVKRIYDLIQQMDQRKKPDDSLIPTERTGLKLEGQKIPVYVPKDAELSLAVKVHNVAVTITNADGLVIGHWETSGSNLYLPQQTKLVNFDLQVLKSGPIHLDIVLVALDKERPKESARTLWQCNLDRLLPENKTIHFTLSLEMQ